MTCLNENMIYMNILQLMSIWDVFHFGLTNNVTSTSHMFLVNMYADLLDM